MSRITDNVKKNSDKFSFISTFFDLVGNKEFKQAEISTLYTTTETKETSIWRSLSAVAEQLGETFYSNTLNFIDNVCNIDLCKVAQLQSMISALGVNYSVFNDIKFMPLEIKKLIDVLSIKREYLTSYVKLDENFVNSMLSGGSYTDVGTVENCIVDELSVLSTSVSACNNLNNFRNAAMELDPSLSVYWNNDQVDYSTTIDDDKLNGYVDNIFKSLLSSKIYQTYNDKNAIIIHENLSDNIILSNFELPNDEAEKINSYRVLFNIPTTFNVYTEVDKYENGEVDLSDYSEQQLSLMTIEIDRRKEPFKENEPKTRYKFYRERDVKEYAEFIVNEYSSTNLAGSYLSSSTYKLDNKYVELYSSKVNTTSLFNSLFTKTSDGSLSVNNDTIEKVAMQLRKITLSIRDIREQLKVQCQKNYMRGTFMFLSYIINEYLRSNIVATMNDIDYLANYKFDKDTTNVDLVEYVDPTIYNNIICDTDDLLSADIADELSTLNKRYWKDTSGLDAIGAIDTTNIFAKLPVLVSQNFIFSESAMSSFYIDMMNNKFFDKTNKSETQVQHLHKFLQRLFELGAENTFLSDDVFHTYDSYTAKCDYEQTSAFHKSCKLSISNEYLKLSNFIPLSVNQAGTTLDEQLSSMYDIYYDAGQDENLKNTNKLSLALSAANELSSVIRISSLMIELNDKYEQIDDNKYSVYEHALETDSFAKQEQLDSYIANSTYNYNQISVSFEQASVYIPTDFKQQNLSLCQQISSLCLSLSSISAAEELETAKTKVLKLSNDIYVANEMSSVIELELILETLSVKYEDMTSVISSELDAIRNTDVFKYRNQLYTQYTGKSIGNTPYYYMANRRHPSFMLHPYLSNYIEKEEYLYPIENVTNIIIENASELIKNNINEYIDDDGYLINMWKNPLNSNADYLTRYEQETHQAANGKESELMSYDGLFYPKALNDFLTDITYPVEEYDSEGNPHSGTATFIEALSGKTIDGYHCSPNNPWYDIFDLTDDERRRIAFQLYTFKDVINKLAKDEKYDIFKYGLDIYKNAYILIKKYDGEVDYDQKCKKDGTLWIRMKNHPIALPAYVLSCENEKYKDLSVGQISFTSSCNTQHHALKLDKYLYHDQLLAPAIKDFTFSTDKNIVVLNGHLSVEQNEEHKDILAAYPIAASINQVFDNNDQITYYRHKIINPKSPILAIVDESTIRQLSDWNFETYFYNDSKIGVIYSKITVEQAEEDSQLSECSVQIYGSYYDPLGTNIKRHDINKKLVDVLSCRNEVLENVCIDVNDNIVTVAYLDEVPTQLSNYIDIPIDLNKLAETYEEEKLELAIKTKQYSIAESMFIPYCKNGNYLSNEHSFIKYTDIGCFGLIGNEDGLSTNLGNTYLGLYDLYERGIYKFQLMSEPVDDIHKMIDFRFTMPVRRLENFNLSTYTTAQETSFKAMNFLCAHYYETLKSTTTSCLSDYSTLSTDVNIYDPYAFKEMIGGKFPMMKADEEYLKYTQSFSATDDKFVDYPYLYFSTSENRTKATDIPDHFVYPYKQVSVDEENCCIFTFSEADTSEFPPISASWCKQDNGEIQIDFNSIYNKLDNDVLSNNIFNHYHLFLNLEKTGDAGVLQVFKDPLNGIFEPLAHYYIKNISDTKPKFLLSAYNYATIEYDGFVFEDNGGTWKDLSVLVTEGIIESKIVNEKAHLANTTRIS